MYQLAVVLNRKWSQTQEQFLGRGAEVRNAAMKLENHFAPADRVGVRKSPEL